MEEAYQKLLNIKGSLSKMFAVTAVISKLLIAFLLSARISPAVINSEKLQRAAVNRFSKRLSIFNGRRRFATSMNKKESGEISKRYSRIYLVEVVFLPLTRLSIGHLSQVVR